MLICHTPVEDGVTRAWHALMVRAPHTPPTANDEANARAYAAASLAAFAQDFELWSTKRAALQVLRLPTDGPFGKARMWYRQFYNPRAEAQRFHERVDGVHRVRGMPAAPQAHAAE